MNKVINIVTGLSLCGAANAAKEHSSNDHASKPNIIVILNDDQGYQDLGCFGSPDIKTPNIDTMAAEGMKFTEFYVASSVCSPSRAALLTGCYPQRVGVHGVFFPNWNQGGLPPEQVTIAEMLKTVGYATKAVGKWHLGDEKQYLPTNQGFDSYYGIPFSNDMYPAKDMEYADDCLYRKGVTQEKIAEAFEKGKLVTDWRKGQPVSMKDYVPLMVNEKCVEFPVDQTTITQRFATEGIKFISESVKQDKPFFLYLANSMPHIPLFASPEFKGKSAEGPYGDTIEEIDHNVGRILNHLKKLNVDQNTIIVYTSDNGPWLEVGKASGHAAPLFEGKFTNFEGGLRVPTVVRWPAKVPAGSVCSEMATTMDLLPTFAHATGAALPNNKALDGKNIIDLFAAKENAKTPHTFFYYGENAVRSGDWKYHAKEVFKVKRTKRDAQGPTLYNLKDDIGETTNVIKDYPEIAERLSKALTAHKKYLSKK